MFPLLVSIFKQLPIAFPLDMSEPAGGDGGLGVGSHRVLHAEGQRASLPYTRSAPCQLP
jgi:hypothetical protein